MIPATLKTLLGDSPAQVCFHLQHRGAGSFGLNSAFRVYSPGKQANTRAAKALLETAGMHLQGRSSASRP